MSILLCLCVYGHGPSRSPSIIHVSLLLGVEKVRQVLRETLARLSGSPGDPRNRTSRPLPWSPESPPVASFRRSRRRCPAERARHRLVRATHVLRRSPTLLRLRTPRAGVSASWCYISRCLCRLPVSCDTAAGSRPLGSPPSLAVFLDRSSLGHNEREAKFSLAIETRRMKVEL